jgi:sortase A
MYSEIPARPVDASKKAKRFGMSPLRTAQWLLMVLGIGLLAAYLGARLQGAFLSRVAILAFKAPDNPAVMLAQPPPQAVPGADVSLWSEKRVEAYKQSLTQHFEPPLALLRISKIHLVAPVFNGTDDLTLNRGVGRIAGTARVGNEGNLGIAGHRDGFFRGLKDIQTGDTIDLVLPDRTETYVVDKIQIVDPTNVSVLQAEPAFSLTLVTCYPFYFIGNAPQRYIVHSSRVALAQPTAGAR